MASEMAVIERSEVESFQNDGIGAIQKAKELARAIVDKETVDRAAEMMLEAKRRIKVVQERFKKPKSDARAAHKSICDLETELIEPYERIEREILKPAIVEYMTAQEAKRREEEDRVREEQRRREESARINEAAKLEKNGHRDLAEAVLDAPIDHPTAVVPREAMPEGIGLRDVWKFRVVDKSKVPSEYLVVDEQRVGAVVRALKGEARIAGIEVYSEKTVSGRV